MNKSGNALHVLEDGASCSVLLCWTFHIQAALNSGNNPPLSRGTQRTVMIMGCSFGEIDENERLIKERRVRMIEFENVSKQYPDGTQALHQVNLKINKGELLVMIGPSGCGKTTMLKMINRLIERTDGTIRIQERPIDEFNIHELRWNIGYVLQQIALFPHMTIAENIAVVPELKNGSLPRFMNGYITCLIWWD